MRWHRIIALSAAVILAGAMPAWALVAADTKAVPTQTITIPPDQSDEADPASGPTPDAPAAPTAPAAAAPSDEPVPVVEYDVSKLPEPVRKLRERILAAAKTGDINQLRPIFAAAPNPPNLGADEADEPDPIAYLKTLSGDPDGREILAILSEVLEAGYVHVDVGTPEELYVWPYFARYPIDKLTPPQMVELFRLLTASDFEEMKNFGAYLFYRVGITKDGEWSSFQAGD
ncbi:hypothetical protein OSH11_22635 [Kaistia dalseonensis]|uniref:Uncharacterized protein n=1 Tax=Kaistia dalseonensis TaxID=410840 RepID=A0ABU0HCV2_9HYPH|nr:hypothetical protein [Kaistia dalseonensis]MCX5497514.1 hypothetical protein [Kaistia dalseonensis]MDQ0440153.1 hypothetical protein [Kaistia dalseonensis]